MSIRKNLFLLSQLLSTLNVFRVDMVDSKLSDYTFICNALDPELSNCLMRSGSEFLKNALNGIAEYGIPAIDPFFVSKANFNVRVLGFGLSLFNLTVRGLEQAEFVSASAEPKNFSFTFHQRLPSLFILSSYVVKGIYYSMPLTGSGKSNITLVNTDVVWKILGEPEYRNEVRYMVPTRFVIDSDPEFMKLQFDNIFNGNRFLERSFNKHLKNNWQEVYQNLKPSIESLCGQILFELTDKIFSVTPYDQFFSDG